LESIWTTAPSLYFQEFTPDGPKSCVSNETKVVFRGTAEAEMP
jgi:hypothetical protein